MSALFAAVATADDGRRDFDFLAGRWRVAHRRLREHLAGCDAWDEFGGLCECRPVIGGLGNVDDNLIELPDGPYRALTLRLFDPTTGDWSIRWVDGRAMRLEPPVFGRFAEGIGRFLGEDRLGDRPITVRFLWSDITADTARWEQAFSGDRGESWEVNWVMRFSRLA